MQIEVQCYMEQRKNAKNKEKMQSTVNAAFEFAYGLSYKQNKVYCINKVVETTNQNENKYCIL